MRSVTPSLPIRNYYGEIMEINKITLKKIAPNLPPRLNPYECPPAPIKELPGSLNPFFADAVKIYLWLGNALPLGNLKFYPAFWMLFNAAAGKLEGIQTLIESSSGSMAYCLAILAKYFGIKRCIFLVPSNIPREKRERLIRAGVAPKDIMAYAENPGKPTTVEIAKGMGCEPHCINLGQYENPDNPGGHEMFTAPSIWKGMAGRVNGIGAGRGTNGVVTGIRDYAERNSHNTLLVGTLSEEESGTVPGVRPKSKIVGAFDWERGIVTPTVHQKLAYQRGADLAANGFGLGPASGLALAGFEIAVRKALVDGSIDQFRDPTGETKIFRGVVICGDGNHLYLQEYADVLR